MASIARKRLLDINYNHQSVKTELDMHLKGWSYVDNLSGEIDDLQLILEDIDGKWINSWFPTKGSTLTATIHQILNGNRETKTYVGAFEVDEIEGGEPSMEIMIKASALPQKSSLKGQEKSRSWENAIPRKIIEDIAKVNKMTLYYKSIETDKIDRVEQESETDIAFLYRFCQEQGLCLKITNKMIVVLDEEEYENDTVKGTINRIPSETDAIKIVNWKFKTSLTTVYKSCIVKNYDSTKKKTIQATFKPTNPPAVGKTLVVDSDIKSISAGYKLAKKKLREANKNADTISMTITTQQHIDAGNTYDLIGFGRMSGKYIVIQVSHGPDTTGLELRKCLEGY